MFKKEHRVTLGLLVLIYFFLNILYLINWGIYWDDWWLVSLSDLDLFEMFNQAGIKSLGVLHYVLRQSPFPILTYRVLLFVCGLISLVSIYWIFINEVIKNKYWSFWASAIFVSVPLNFAKMTLICFPYVLCSTFFYLGFALMLSEKQRILFRVLSIVLFFLSFFISSLVPFYLIFLLTLYWRNLHPADFFRWESVLSFIKEKPDFILLPILFALLKYTVFTRPYGAYLGYNSIQLSIPMLAGILSQVIHATTVVLKTVFSSFDVVRCFSVFFVLLISGQAILTFRRKWGFMDDSTILTRDQFFKIIIFFIFSVFLAIAPYILIGRIGSTFGTEWEDRDTLLLPFGLALLFVIFSIFITSSQYLIENVRLKNLLTFVLPMFFVVIFSSSTITFQHQLLKDSIKQDFILGSFRSNIEVKNNASFKFDDHYREANIYSRAYRSYELNGMAMSVFGDQKRFFILDGKLSEACPQDTEVGSICKDWERNDSIDRKIELEKSSYKKQLGPKVLDLVFLRYLNPIEYNDKIKKFFTLKITNF